jgi:hypothetical protein
LASVASSLLRRGNLEDWLVARLAPRATLFALDSAGACSALAFQAGSDDGSFGSVRVGAEALEYWVEAGVLTVLRNSQPISARPLTGATEISIVLGESELFFSESACQAHGRRSAPLLFGQGRLNSNDSHFFSFFQPGKPRSLSLRSGQSLSAVRERGVGPWRLSLGLPDGLVSVFAYPGHGVAWVDVSTPRGPRRGLYPLKLGPESLAIGPLRLWYAPPAGDVTGAGVEPPTAIYEATVDAREAFQPMQEYRDTVGPLFWPVLTSHGVSCIPHELRGASGSVILESGQERHEHRYTQNEFGIELDPADCVSYYPGGGGQQRVYCPSMPRRDLVVHGRDEVSYFVDGSRWFLTAAACEAAKARVRPFELQFVRVVTPHLAAAKVQPRRTPLQSWPWPEKIYRRVTGAPVCDELSFFPRPSLHAVGARRGRLKISRANAALQSYDYELFPDPLAIWLSARGKGGDRMSGEVRPISLASVAKGGVLIGGELWFRSREECEAGPVPAADAPRRTP